MKATNQYQITQAASTDAKVWPANVKENDMLAAAPGGGMSELLDPFSCVLGTRYEGFTGRTLFKVALRSGEFRWVGSEHFLVASKAKADETEKSHLKALAPDSLLDQAIEAVESAHKALKALAEAEEVKEVQGFVTRQLYRQETGLSDLVEWLKDMKRPPNTSDIRAREGNRT